MHIQENIYVCVYVFAFQVLTQQQGLTYCFWSFLVTWGVCFRNLNFLVQWCVKHNTEQLAGIQVFAQNGYHTFSEAVPIKAARRFLTWFIYCSALIELP